MRYCLLSLCMLLVYTGCVKKTNKETISILEEICRIEEARQGKNLPGHSFIIFGNPAIDLYEELPGDPEEILRFIGPQSDVCRYVLLQLMVKLHPDYFRRHFDEIAPTLSENEKYQLIHAIRYYKVDQLADTILHYLSPEEPSVVREGAAFALTILPIDKYFKTITKYIRNEKDSKVLHSLVMALDPDKHPRVNTFFKTLQDHPDTSLHQSILLLWSTSNLPDKRELITRYREHSDPTVKELAIGMLNELDGKEKLSFKIQGISFGGGEPVNEEKSEREIDMEKQVCLLTAIKRNNLEQIKKCLADGAKLNVPFHTGSTPLMLAVQIADDDIFEYLIEAGADPKQTCDDGVTTVMAFAMIRIRKDLSRMPRLIKLAKMGVDLDAVNDEGETALMIAARWGNSFTVRALLNLGADPNIKAQDGSTAADISLRENHEGIPAIIAEYQ